MFHPQIGIPATSLVTPGYGLDVLYWRGLQAEGGKKFVQAIRQPMIFCLRDKWSCRLE